MMTNPSPAVDSSASDLSELATRAEQLVAEWLRAVVSAATKEEEQVAERLRGVVADPAGVRFTMRFVDRVVRSDDDSVAADQLASLVGAGELPAFLGFIDRLLLRAGGLVAPRLPKLVMPLARRRMRSIVGHLVVDATEQKMSRHVGGRRADGFDLNVNLLGEAVLGSGQAAHRFDESMRLLAQPDVDYVSIKLSSVVPRLNPWDHDGSITRVADRLRPLLRTASNTSPPTFINLDMEEYHDLELTLDVFMKVLSEPEFHHVDAGIVLQAYLPDSFPALQRLTMWANDRRGRTVDGRPGGVVKIRLVKGANLAMERVESALRGWEQAPYRTKAETDANYKRCLDWLVRPEHLVGVRVGVASHNLFDCSFAHLLATERGVEESVSLEMLEGMAHTHARVTMAHTGKMLLYTPIVDPADFDVAISYLFRRLEENTSDENFIRYLFEIEPGSDRFEAEADKFRRAVADRWSVGTGAQRHQDRPQLLPRNDPDTGFENEPDTDPSLPENRAWVADVLAREIDGPTAAVVDDATEIDRIVERASQAQPEWWNDGGAARQRILHAAGDQLAAGRGDLIAAMVAEGSKTVAQADPEVSEAVDFAHYYADRAAEVQPENRAAADGLQFAPFGVVLITPPWNFPVAIVAGGVLAALAAGNSVILKPAPETPRCAELVAELCWRAGVPSDVLHYVRTNDDDVGQHLVAHPGVDGVILTGATETAKLFQNWRPERPLFAETSGKNSMIITPSADLDLAVADLVDSAFGHGGQKCSAASLAIVVGSVYRSSRFRSQLIDAVESLHVGDAHDPGTDLAPLIAEPQGKLRRALTELEPGEEWLVKPERIGTGRWSPGVRIGVVGDSWFHRTECFGPVLGIMAAGDLDEAIALQNATSFGLTGGIHSLDDTEVDHWLDAVEVGNAYVNRGTTGAIVQRQPFGGWKASSVGPGAKAGGPNYVSQLGRWVDAGPNGDDDGRAWLAAATASDQSSWADEFGLEHDPTGLFCEANIFRYRPLDRIAVRVENDVAPAVVRRVEAALERVGVSAVWSMAATESQADFASRLGGLGVERVRLLGRAESELREAAIAYGVYVADEPVVADGRRELLFYLHEQSISRTRHRYGNVV